MYQPQYYFFLPGMGVADAEPTYCVLGGWCVQLSSGRAVNLGVFLELNLPRTAVRSNTISSRTLSTKVSCWSKESIDRLKILSWLVFTSNTVKYGCTVV